VGGKLCSFARLIYTPQECRAVSAVAAAASYRRPHQINDQQMSHSLRQPGSAAGHLEKNGENNSAFETFQIS